MLIADRFIDHHGRTIDLATGEAAVLRRMPGVDRSGELDWNDRCAQLCLSPPDDDARLIDYGMLNDGARFEAYRTGKVEPAAVTYANSSHASNAPRHRPMEAASELALLVQQADDLFETACLGEPRRLHLIVARRDPPLAFIDALARRARLCGFVPMSLDLLVNAERLRRPPWEELRDILGSRHLLLIVGAGTACSRRGWCSGDGQRAAVCPVAIARMALLTGTLSARPNILLSIHPRTGTPAARPACLMSRPGGGRSLVAAEAHETYKVGGGAADLSKVRAHAAQVVADARSGQPMRAETALRDVMGALARRDDAASSGWVALNLGCLLLERGRALDAARTFLDARAQFDRVNDLAGAVRAAIYLGLAWTDEGRFSEGEAACRSAQIAAREAGVENLAAEASVALARNLYWQGRVDEATVLVGSAADEGEVLKMTGAVHALEPAYPLNPRGARAPVVRDSEAAPMWNVEPRVIPLARATGEESDRRVRAIALAARLALRRGDLRTASARGVEALGVAGESGAAIDGCVAHTTLASLYAALHDVDRLAEHTRAGIAIARRAHAPLRALRLRLIACDGLRLAGRSREASRLLRRLATLDATRFPALLRTQLEIVVKGQSRTGTTLGRAMSQELAAAACPWRLEAPSTNVADEVVGVLQVCHEIEDEELAVARVCEVVRERLHAVAVTVAGRDGAAPALLARSGAHGPLSAVVERILETGMAVAPARTDVGIEAGSPIRYGGVTVGALGSRWVADALFDPGRVACVLSAAAAATAPHVRTLLDRRAMAPVQHGDSQPILVGESEAMQTLRKAAQRAAAAPFPVLIEGESGSGKELVARAIHRDGPRRARRFCAVNCAALTDELLEAELFGHVRGAFTGAVTDRIGLFEEADGGTLFLDEVADLSSRAQAKLLRVLQDGEVRRIGENIARHVDVRVVAATNRRLEDGVNAGTFRRDLFYRLNVVHVDVPPLRDRAEDIPALAAHFWSRSIGRTGSRATLAPSTVAVLCHYDWPGNVRELQNVMASLAVSAPRRGSIGPACLPAAVARAETKTATLDEARRVFERRFVQAALARGGGHRGRAAASLGISRQGLAKLLVRLGLSADSTE